MVDPTARLDAALEGRYSIEEKLGEGGMAIVYLANDLRHERQVALKVLKPELAAVVGSERFLAEIKTTANLQHPHILPLFDSGEADGFLYYVMPYVGGESLRNRLDRERQLPVDDAVAIAKNVAEALGYAHGRGVIHRDIKPANILLLEGKPVISDFGIALAVGAAGGGRLTETGLSMGTPHYMSPEQATGDAHVGPPSDVYALGCVLYEMLVGEPPHTGSTPQAVLGKIITEPPTPVTRLRSMVPSHVEAVIAKALEKVPADRFANATALAEALDDSGFRHERAAPSEGGRRTRRTHRTAEIALGVMALVFAALAVWGWGRNGSATEARTRRYSIVLPDSAPLALGTGRPAVVLSGDGRRLVYVSRTRGRQQLLIRDLRDGTVTAIDGGQDGSGPFVSNDGGLAFHKGALLMEASLEGGPARVMGGLTPVTRGAAWLSDTALVVASSPNGGLIVVPPEGPEGGQVSFLTPELESRAWPSVLPGDESVIYAVSEGEDPNAWSVSVVTPEGRERILVERATHPTYSPTGHLLFLRDGALWSIRFDADALETSGEARIVQPGILSEPGGLGHFSLASDGTLVFAEGGGWEIARRLVWVDPDGSLEPTELPVGAYTEVSLSPDGRRVAVTRGDGSNFDVWVGPIERGTLTRETHDPNEDGSPVWSPDGTRLAIATEQFGEPPKLGVIDLDGNEITLAAEAGRQFSAPTGWGRDGRIYYTYSPIGIGLEHARRDIRSTEAHPGDGEPWLATPNDERSAVPSPNGRWVAYESDESGRPEVYVRSVEGGRRFRVSSENGREPRWGGTTGSLFYREGDRVFSVEVGDDVDALLSSSTVRFRLPASLYLAGGFNTPSWDLAPSESRLLALEELGSEPVTTLHVVVGFFSVLEGGGG